MPHKIFVFLASLLLGSLHINAGAEETMTGVEETMRGAQVSRTAFTTNIENREPVDDVTGLDTSQTKVFFFSEIINMSGESIIHRWHYNGEIMTEVSFDIGGPRWRIYSSKNLMPHWTGEWRVDVLDAKGTIIAEKSFTYGAIE